MGRHALLISTDTYVDKTLQKLRSPRTDAETLADVLADQEIAGFSVTRLHNIASHEARVKLNELFDGCRGDDLVVVYFSCHGVKDDRGKLHFAFSDTLHNRLPSTAIPADFVGELMEASPARRIVLFLDCCFSGAFTRGMRTKAGGKVDVLERFAGRGRAVITATSAMEYAFEIDHDTIADANPMPTPSVFTAALIRGLTTGEADRGGDGVVTVDELYEYIYDQVRARTTKQTPSRWFNVEGSLALAQVRDRLPEALRRQLAEPLPETRIAAIPELGRMVTEINGPLAQVAWLALKQLTEDDSRKVSAEASRVLAALPQPRPPTPRTPIRDPEPRQGIKGLAQRVLRRRRLIVAALLLALLGGGAAIVMSNNSNSQYWVGIHDDHVAVLRGTPGNINESTVIDRTLIRRDVVQAQESRLLNGIKATSLAEARQTANCSLLSLPPACLFAAAASPFRATPPAPPTPTLQSGRQLFKDDFSSQKNGWSREDSKIARKQYLNGAYRILVKKPEYGIIGYPSILYEELAGLRDAGVEVEAGKLAGDDDNQFGVMCRYADDNNYYVIHISSNGQYGFEKRLNGKWTLLKDGPTDAVKPTSMNSISVSCVGGRNRQPVKLSLWLNGHLLSEVTDSKDAISTGEVGLYAFSSSKPTDIIFDNIAAFEI